jgi:ankyrin repeat protein
MVIKIYDQFNGGNSREKIESLESYIGYSLPESYRLFLFKNNGGRIKPNAFNTIHNEIESLVHFMYGFTQKSNYDIKSNYNRWINGGASVQYLPIATDVWGNDIVLDLVSHHGRVLFWSHNTPELQFIEISGDFDSFFRNIYKITLKESDLDMAIGRQDIKYFDKRVANGEHVDDIKNEFSQTAVIMASLRNKVELLAFFKANGSKMDKALFSAASNGHYESVRYLLSLGVDPNERDIEQNNDTALIQAAYGGNIEIVKLLVEAGADINAKDKYEQSVLAKASWSDNAELIAYLESLGAIR